MGRNWPIPNNLGENDGQIQKNPLMQLLGIVSRDQYVSNVRWGFQRVSVYIRTFKTTTQISTDSSVIFIMKKDSSLAVFLEYDPA